MTQSNVINSDLTQAIPAANSPRDIPRFAPPILLFSIGLLILARTWGTWTDLTVDFGREAYLAWRIAEGDPIYQHIASFAGPVSPTFNALLVTIYSNLTGSSTSSSTIPALVFGNIVIFSILIAIAYRLLRIFTHRLPATLACGCAIACCMGLQTTGVGNFNFITPYAHELTHGLTVALLTLLTLARILFSPHRRTPRLILAGTLVGLSIHLKPEIALALLPTVAIVLTLQAIPFPYRPNRLARTFQSSHRARLNIRHALALLTPALLVALAVPLLYGFDNVFKGWSHLRDETIRAMPFYQRVSGFDAIADNVSFAVGRAFWVAAILLLLRYLTRSTTAQPPISHRPLARCALAVPLALGLAWLSSRLVDPAPAGLAWIWLESTRSWTILLPLIAIIAGITHLRIRFARTKSETNSGSNNLDQDQLRRLTLIMLTCFATLCLAKIALSVSLQHYGFALALPALLVVAVLLCAPRLIDATPPDSASSQSHVTTSLSATSPLDATSPLGATNPFGATSSPTAPSMLGVSLVIAFAVAHVWIAGFWQDRKTDPLASLRLLKIDPNRSISRDFLHAMNHIRSQAQPGDGLAVLPEGALLNLLTDQPNPSGYIVTMPVEVLMFGQTNILTALQNNPPRWIALRQTSLKAEYAVEGLNHMPDVVAWIHSNYQPIGRPNDDADQRGSPPSILLLERIDATFINAPVAR